MLFLTTLLLEYDEMKENLRQMTFLINLTNTRKLSLV